MQLQLPKIDKTCLTRVLLHTHAPVGVKRIGGYIGTTEGIYIVVKWSVTPQGIFKGCSTMAEINGHASSFPHVFVIFTVAEEDCTTGNFSTSNRMFQTSCHIMNPIKCVELRFELLSKELNIAYLDPLRFFSSERQAVVMKFQNYKQ